MLFGNHLGNHAFNPFQNYFLRWVTAVNQGLKDSCSPYYRYAQFPNRTVNRLFLFDHLIDQLSTTSFNRSTGWAVVGRGQIRSSGRSA